MIKNIIFDYGGVLIDWNPLYLYEPFFGDKEKARWFVDHICTLEWAGSMDDGTPISEGVAKLSAQYPEWTDAIAVFQTRWRETVGGPIPGMYELVCRLKEQGYHLFGLSNWNWDTFVTVKDDFPVLAELEGMIISGKEHVIKPHPAIYQLLLERFQLKAEECIFIDDNSANIVGAQAVGIQAIQFSGMANLMNDLRAMGLLR